VGVHFKSDVTFAKARFEVGAALNVSDAGFAASVNFAGAAFKRWAHFRFTRFHGMVNFDNVILKDSDFSHATFEEIARFSNADFRGGVALPRAIFETYVTFESATFHGGADFSFVVFRGITTFHGAVFEGNAYFSEVHFGGGTAWLRPMLVTEQLQLDGTVFAQPTYLAVGAGELSCKGTRFLAGGHIRIAWAAITLTEAEFPVPFLFSAVTLSSIAPQEAIERASISDILEGTSKAKTVAIPSWKPYVTLEDPGPGVTSLERADVAGLVLSGIDMSSCRFADAHHLDQLRIEARRAFDQTPIWHRRSRASRQAIAEEFTWRSHRPFGQRWRREGRTNRQIGGKSSAFVIRPRRSTPVPLEPDAIAAIYRALRKGREDRRDEPGAADFYYGEMEMRRGGSSRPTAEWLVLTLYWLLSGYALRAWRALAAIVVVLSLSAWLLQREGFLYPSSFTDAMIYSARTAIGLLRDPQPPLSRFGDVVQLGVRISVPFLLGLAVLSIRGRVKR
jgi:uncharacterized protein YjbI with pentapeptide repeats